MKRILIKNGLVMNRQFDTEQKDILIEGKTIRDIRADLHADGAEVIDAAGKIVMPGLVDTHRHVWESILRHIGTDWSLPQYLENIYYGNLGSQLSTEDMYIANLWGALEALDAGVTTLFDYSMLETPEHADAAIKGLEDAGIRAVFAHGVSGRGEYWDRESEKRHPAEDARRVKKEYFQSEDQLLTMALGVRGPEFSAWETAVDDIKLAAELDAIASMHIGFGAWGPHDRSITRLNEAGLLTDRLNLVHVNRIQLEEYRLIAESGASLSVTPEVEMMMGHGYPATGQLHRHKGLVTLGVDVVVSTAGDLFTQMKFALQAERARQNEQILDRGEMPEQLGLTVKDVLAFATRDGAKALGLGHKTGTLEPGMEADITIIDPSSFNLHPLNQSPAGAVVQSARPENVDTVLTAGRIVKQNGRLVKDVSRLREQVAQASENVFLRQHKNREVNAD
ncbi:amidohydrolase family protein [Alteribacter natronophilus]|uniref:amidohydrolase family protein n=1 Tax=Alteribacter natronophilus TaxID=2583810 RepID=UPI00110E388C|nr:amidohydrolase family protein [Alteribacter natronophilus]TMW72863.1 amidohydrolase family protein [Alteribacter natronophilus]